ncbi:MULTISPECIES: carbohydrate ABC transporter permease [Caldilinea]|nr:MULTISPECIES: sugar ABC transporter permease [Caldilinea]GIV73025.1 MAG: sugar ABC transporter permease [Caldilinea sp.]
MATSTLSPSRTAVAQNQRWKQLRKQLPNYLFILPHFFFFSVFLLYPIFRGLQISLYDWKIMLKDQAFIGLANYQALLQDKIFWQTLNNTAYFTVLTVVMNVILALFVATGLKHPFIGSNFLRVLFYAPGILSVSVLGIIGIRVWDTQIGILNYFITTMLGGPRIAWLGNPDMVIPALAVTTVWWTFGFPMLVFIAGMHNIPEPLYEAAKIDGAGPLQTFRHITLPLLMPTMLFVVVTQFIAHMQVFAQPYIITGGGPGNASRSATMYLYETAWKFFRFGYASSISVVLALIMIVVTVILFMLMRRRTEY